jgi:2-methylcitrate dehydratase PrpD
MEMMARKQTISQFLVARGLQLPAGKIPASAMKRAAICIKDTIGISLAAARLGNGLAATRIAQLDAGPVTLWGLGRASTAIDAAFANGMLAHCIDFDDLHPEAIMHSSAVVVPALLAVSEQHRLNSTEMLATAVLGYEVAAFLGRLAPGDFQNNGFQSTAVLGIFAAAFMAARAMKLSPDQAVHALGLAGSMAGGLMEFLSDGSDAKQIHAGWAAQSGIRAAQLAAQGVTGPTSVFEGRFGVYRAFVGRDVQLAAQQGFGQDGAWAVEEMCPKPYPACLCVHPFVQGMLDIRSRTGGEIELEQIVSIRCDVPSFYIGLVFDPLERKSAPQTSYEARFSAPFCMAVAWVDGKLDVDSFSSSRLRDADILSLASKISYRAEALPEFPATFPGRVTLETANKGTIQSYIKANIGSISNPMTATQLDDKFMAGLKGGMSDGTARALSEAIERLVMPGAERKFFQLLKEAAAENIQRQAVPVPSSLTECA